MSWFDTSGIANLAKSALKEAQKTIDKALDITEDENKSAEADRSEEANFFSTWGIKNGTEDDPTTTGESSESRKQQESGLWGSFTGSFFENSKSNQRLSRRVERSESLEEDSSTRSIAAAGRLSASASLHEDLSRSERPIVESETSPKLEIIREVGVKLRRTKIGSSASSLLEAGDTFDPNDVDTKRRYSEGTPLGDDDKVDNETIDDRHAESDAGVDLQKNLFRPATDSVVSEADRASVISVCSESDKKSSESLEILGSQSDSNTDCTTTPDSDVTSSSIVSSVTPRETKRNSDSVEILPDSLVTSPSSVEILADPRTKSISPCFSTVDQREYPGETISISSASVSPYVSPLDEDSKTTIGDVSTDYHPDFQSGLSKIANSGDVDVSPESVEVIPDLDETDETSQAEDSYTSVSETTIITIGEANSRKQTDTTSKMKIEIADSKRLHASCSDSSRHANNPIVAINSDVISDSSMEKQNLHQPVEPITRQPIGEFVVERIMSRMSENETSDQIKDSTIEPAGDDDNADSEKFRNNQPQNDNADCPEQHLMLTDSSCEGTLIESSSEDNVTVVKGNETKVNESTPLTASSYVKNMLADAMVEKGEIGNDGNDGNESNRTEVSARENSPISSESRSDLVKIGSDQTSGHTSGDELETTTSSDIEIISRYSPNGDSSSTQSRQSPANLQSSKGNDLLTRTLKSRGHSRELSEISVGSDDVNYEIEKLLKRVQEMTEILEVRESKLIDVSRINMELHEQNINMKKQLDSIETRAGHNQEINRMTEDYTQRLSSLEKKFQQAIGERDSLSEKLEQLKHEASTRLSSRETMTMIAEKDEIIRELRIEGEKLSKQQLQHSNIIKKLRAKEKDMETLTKSQKEQLDEQSSELERLKRSLHAKEEVERSQIEAVHTLTARNKKRESEILSLQEKLDNALNKMEAYKTSFEAAKTDLVDSKRKLEFAEEELKRILENAGESCQLSAQVEDLKLKLRKSEESHVKSVEALKRSNNELLKRFEAAEARSEELSESVTLATKPLLRQLEQLQASFVVKTNNFAKQEKLMSESIDELQTKLESLVATDRSLVEENLSLRGKVSSLESQIKRKEMERIEIADALEKLKCDYEKLEETNSRQQTMLKNLEETNDEQMKELKREIKSLTDKLSVERAATDAEKRKNHAILEQQHSVDEESRLSPTLSIGRDSIGSTSSVWPAFNESLFESGSGRFPSVYDSLRATGNSTSMIENLQAQVKQRDGEIQQLQWEISRRNNERDALNIELSVLSSKIEELTNKVTDYDNLNESLNEVQTRYDALLQMYGEKVEETEELRLDLEDVKEMYKSQIDQLLKRDAHH